MVIANRTEAQLEEVLAEHFSPSQEIREPERLLGRERDLTRIRRSLASPGRHIFIYGERGVGKTSLAITAGKLQSEENKNFIYVACGQNTTFFEVIHAIGCSILPAGNAVASSGPSLGFGLNVLGTGANFNYSGADQTVLAAPTTMSEAYNILRFVRSQLTNQIIIVIDELDRIQSREERTNFSELIKNVGSVVDDMRFILCGIGANVDELIGEHLSTGRMFEPVEVERLTADNLWKIIEQVADELEVDVPRGHLIRVGIISDGFPHYVHLIGQSIFYKMHDDLEVVTTCSNEHFLLALKEATSSAEPSLRQIYQIATEKSKNKRDYEECLWALADRTATRRQIGEVYDSSYKRIQREHQIKSPDENKTRLSRTQVNARLLSMRDERHAKIILGHGSGWFSFRENVMRGYVRLKAETSGVTLVPEITA